MLRTGSRPGRQLGTVEGTAIGSKRDALRWWGLRAWKVETRAVNGRFACCLVQWRRTVIVPVLSECEVTRFQSDRHTSAHSFYEGTRQFGMEIFGCCTARQYSYVMYTVETPTEQVLSYELSFSVRPSNATSDRAQPADLEVVHVVPVRVTSCETEHESGPASGLGLRRARVQTTGDDPAATEGVGEI